ncbi:MAG: hypothetical protein WC314_04445 [Vulcanimicrobiota bacterium]
MRHLRLASLLIGLALFCAPLAGCGANEDTFAGTPLQQYPEEFVGRLDLGFGQNFGSTTVIEFQDLDGRPLAQTSLDAFGDFRLPAASLPSAFRIVARVAPGLEFASDVRDYPASGSTNINVPTSLASAYLQANPGESLQAAEDLVRAYLHFPPERRLGQDIEESPRSIFSQYAFFVKAAQNGGWPAYRDQIVSRLSESPETSPVYRLTRVELKHDLSALHPELAGALQNLRASGDFRLAMTSLSAHPVENIGRKLSGDHVRLVAETAPGSARSEVRMKILKSITEKAIESAVDIAIDQAVDVGWTHVAEGLGLNYGTTAKLDAIQESLNAMQEYLNELGSTINQNAIEAAANEIAEDISTISALNRDLVANRVGTNIDAEEQPFVPSQSVSGLVSSLLGFEAQTALLTIQNSMLGAGQQSSLLEDVRDKLLEDDFGVHSRADNGQFAVRSNQLIDESLQAFAYYAGYQQLGANILGEISHLGTQASPPQNPISSMQISQGIVTDAIISLKKQRSLSPFYQASDNIFVDLQAGLMWYTVMQSERSMSDALDYAETYTATVTYQTSLLDSESEQPLGLPVSVVSVTYDDWHLPTRNEYRTLQDRARLVATDRRDTSVPHSGDNGYGDYDSASQGLPAFGFTGLNKLNTNGSMLCSDWRFDNDGDWYPQWTGKFDANNEFIFNNGGLTDIGQTTNKRPFLLVRPIGEPVLPVGEDTFLGTPNTPYPYPWSEIRAEEYPFLGHVTGVVGGGGITLDQLGATLEWTVTVGGTSTLGASNDVTWTLPVRNYIHRLLTYSGEAGSADVELVDFSDLVWFTSSNEDIASVTPNGRMYWHVDDSQIQNLDFTAHVYDASGNEKSYTFTVNEYPPVRQLTAVQIYPRNRTYSVPAGSPSVQEKYYCIAYYSDNTVKDVSSEVTWELVTNDTGAPVDPDTATVAPKGDSDHGNFIGKTPPADTILKLKASLGSESIQNDEVLLELTDGV